jgi:hypothetical protein
MIIDVKATRKTGEGCLIQRTTKVDETPILIPWDEFNSIFNKTSWENYYTVEIDDADLEKSLEKIKFIEKNLKHLTEKTSWTRRKIKEYLEKFNSNSDDYVFHLGVFERLKNMDLV